jgi:hypothetical protein
MAKYLVTMLIGVIVEAEDDAHAREKASLPLRLGALPGVCAVSMTGSRLSVEDDEHGIQKRLNEMSRGAT